MVIALISLVLTVSITFAFSSTNGSSSMPITNSTTMQTIPSWKFSSAPPPQFCPAFSNTLNLNNSPFDTSTPGVAAVGKNVYLIYKENSNNSPSNNSPLLYKRGIDGGANFSKGIVLAQSVDYLPRIAAIASNFYVVWQSFSPQGIFFVRSTDSGLSFEKPIKLGKVATGLLSLLTVL